MAEEAACIMCAWMSITGSAASERVWSVSYTHLKEDPYSKRSVEENLDLFERMKNGEFEDGTKAVSYTHLDVYKRQM